MQEVLPKGDAALVASLESLDELGMQAKLKASKYHYSISGIRSNLNVCVFTCVCVRACVLVCARVCSCAFWDVRHSTHPCMKGGWLHNSGEKVGFIVYKQLTINVLS